MQHNMLNIRPNTLYHGDCLEIMENWPDACVDLIYLDPPFNSNANYNILYGKDQKGKPRTELAQFTAFNDTWYWNSEAAERVTNMKRAAGFPAHKAIRGLAEMLPEGGMLAYLSYMAQRVVEMHRLLKDNGSLYLHCDPTASHYLKTIMDTVFDAKNFRNEIVWHYNKWTNAAKYFQRNHDVIFLYSKSSSYQFNKQFTITAHKEMVLDRGWDTNVASGTKQLLVYDRKKASKQIAVAPEKGQKVVYMDSKPPGVATPDVWADINYISSGAKERLGYPTQKPLALLERIVEASSQKGDLVLDPFCGCGTTAHASYNLGREFIGIDISPYAITRVCRERLKNAAGVSVLGLPTDMDSARELARDKPFVFEQWAITCLPGFEPNDRQTGDGGVDGHGFLLNPPENEDGTQEKGKCVAQVKGGNVSPDAMRALLSQITGGYASMGIFITLDKIRMKPTVKEVTAKAGTFQPKGSAKTFNRIAFWSIAEHFDKIEPKLPDMAHPRTGKGQQEEIPIL